MARLKQRQFAAKPATNNVTQDDLVDSTSLIVKSDLCGEDSWVVVKKQRVTILVPPLPVAKSSTQQEHAMFDLQPLPLDMIENPQGAPAEKTSPTVPLTNEPEKFAKVDSRKGSNFDRTSLDQCTSNLPAQPLLNVDSARATEVPKVKRACSNSRTVRWPTLVHGLSNLDSNKVLNQKLRALNLERKLQKVGGLQRWLESMGLGQFVEFFQRKRIGKFQLVNLTMEKLKDMGATAVGPRRKLINAIECICQPHSLNAPRMMMQRR